jgi:hypothetical protein
MHISVGTESVCPQFCVCHGYTHSRFEAVYSRFLFLLDQTVAARCSARCLMDSCMSFFLCSCFFSILLVNPSSFVFIKIYVGVLSSHHNVLTILLTYHIYCYVIGDSTSNFSNHLFMVFS